MRIRESAYIALTCLFFSADHSSAQFAVSGPLNGSELTHYGRWDIQFLSQPKQQLNSLQAGSKVIFSSLTECEIYDFASDSWETHSYSVPRRNTAQVTAGYKAFFAGGSRGSKADKEFISHVDVYNAYHNTWHTSRLSEAREVGAAGAFGNVAIFAGGITEKGYSSRADILNTEYRMRSYHNLSESRTQLAAGAAGNKIVFAGGLTGDMKQSVPSNAVDIYEVHSRTWSTARLSVGRYGIAVATVGNKIIFAGGLTTSGNIAKPSRTVDLYDAVKNTWSCIKLSEAKYGMSVAVAGNKVYFAGGIKAHNVLSDKIEVYDAETNTWSVSTMPVRRQGMAVAVTPSRIMFAGGLACSADIPTSRVEVLNIETGKWSVEYLSKKRVNVSSASYKGKTVFAGGVDGTVASAIIDSWQETNYIQNTAYTIQTGDIDRTRREPGYEWVYNHPQNHNVIVADLWKYETRTVSITILNGLRQPVITRSVIPFGDTKESIDVSALTQGQYSVLIECRGSKPVLKQVSIKGRDTDAEMQQTILAMFHPNPDMPD